MAHHEGRVTRVVVNHHDLGECEPEIRQTDRIWICIGNPLDKANPVVTHETHCAAEEWRQTSNLGNDGVDFRQFFSQIREWISVDLEALGRATLGPLDVSPARTEDRTGPSADEAVAGPLFRALGRLEEKARLAVVETPKERQGGVQIGADLAHDGDQISAGRELLERISGGAVQLGLSLGALMHAAWEKWCKNSLLSNSLEVVKEADLIQTPQPRGRRVVAEAHEAEEHIESESEFAALAHLHPQRPAFAPAQILEGGPMVQQK